MHNLPLFQRYKQILQWLQQELHHNQELKKVERNLIRLYSSVEHPCRQQRTYIQQEVDHIERSIEYSNMIAYRQFHYS